MLFVSLKGYCENIYKSLWVLQTKGRKHDMWLFVVSLKKNWVNILGLPGGLVVKNLPASIGDAGDVGSIPGSGRCPGEGNGNPLQCSCLENAMDRGPWRATVRGVTKSWTQLSTHHLLWQTTQCKATKLFCTLLHKSFSFNFFFYFCVGFLYRL